MALPENLKLIRLMTGLSQTEFGSKFKATKAMIVSYEKGKATPDSLFLSRLAKFAQVTEEDLKNKNLDESDLKVELEQKLDMADFVDVNDKSAADNAITKTVDIPNEDSKTDLLPMQAINNLVLSNKTLADSHKILAETNRRLADKIISSTESGKKETLPDFETIFGNLLELLSDVLTDKEPRSKREVAALLSRVYHVEK